MLDKRSSVGIGKVGWAKAVLLKGHLGELHPPSITPIILPFSKEKTIRGIPQCEEELANKYCLLC